MDYNIHFLREFRHLTTANNDTQAKCLDQTNEDNP